MFRSNKKQDIIDRLSVYKSSDVVTIFDSKGNVYGIMDISSGQFGVNIRIYEDNSKTMNRKDIFKNIAK